uniref:Uncharacterized protein n=1 Tax=Arundo donax TaxID=35708 RepID=A0A0A8YZV5_ARUDO
MGSTAWRVALSASSSARTSPSIQLEQGSRALGHCSSTHSKPWRSLLLPTQFPARWHSTVGAPPVFKGLVLHSWREICVAAP